MGNLSNCNNWYADACPTIWNSSTDLLFNLKNNASQTTMFHDIGWKDVKSIIYAGTFPYGVPLIGNGSSGFNFWYKVQNFSTYAQTISVPLSGYGTTLELDPTNADMTFDNTIFNSSNANYDVYGPNSKMLTLNGQLFGNSSVSLNIHEYSKVAIGYNHGAGSFGGGANVYTGELWFQPASAINGGTINVGSSGTTAKVYLNATTGGLTLPNNLVVVAGSTSTIGGLNSSGTNTFSGSVTLNSGVNLETVSGGTIDFAGNISGNYPVTISRVSGAAKAIIRYSTIAKSYTGTTTVANGTTLVLYTANIVPASNNFSVLSGGTLRIGADQTIGNLDLPAGSTLIVNPATTLIINGTYTGGGTITNNGTIILVGPSAFPGASTTVSAMANLTVNRAGGVVLDKAMTVSNVFTLTNGVVTTTAANLLSISNTATSAIAGGSPTSYISGPVLWTFPANLAAGSTYSIPIGKGSYMPMAIIDPVTGAGIITITAEVNNTPTGGSPGGSLSSISSTEFWVLTSTGNLTNHRVSLTRQTAVTPFNRIGRSTTVTGAYASVGGTPSGNSIINSNNTGAGASQYFVMAKAGAINVANANPASNGDYATLKAAFDAINASAQTGNNILVTINGGTVETATATLNQNAAPWSSMVIYPTATGYTVSGALATPLIYLNGADNVTINGNYLGGGQTLLLRNTNAIPSNTGPSIQYANGTLACTLTGCDIENNGTGATSGSILIGTGTNSVTISGNKIHDATGGTTGRPFIAIYSNSVNNSVTIDGNDIYNWSFTGVFLNNIANGASVTSNSFFQPTDNSTDVEQCAIDVRAGINHTISNNYIGGKATHCGGLAWVTSADVYFTGIYLSVGTTSPTSVQGNTIQNISLTSTNSNTWGSLFYGIEVAAGLVNVGTTTGNIIGHAVTANSISIAGTNTVPNYSSLIDGKDSYTGSCFENNVLANYTYTGTGAVYTYILTLNGNARKNRIYNVGSSTAGATGQIDGIHLTGTGGGECSNNFIALSGGNATNPTVYGIYANAATAAVNYIYYNSINIFGTATASSSTYAFRRANNSPFVLKNNILVNNRSAGGSGTHLAIYISPTGSLTSDYNDLFTAKASTLGYWPISYYDFAGWKTASGQDSHSINVAPVFVSNTNLHLVTSSNDGIDKKGTPLGAVTADIDGNARDAVTPDIGADEFVSTSCSPVTGGTASGSTSFCGSGTPSITATGYSVITGTTYQWQYSNDNFSNAGDVAGQINPAVLTTGVVSVTTWYRLRVTCPAAFDTGYSSVVAVTINVVPAAVTVTPSSATICNGNIQQLVATGGALPVTILSENFNAGSNNWAKINNSTFGTPANAAWTLRPDGYSYTGTWHSNDNTQFYLSNSDAQGSGGVTATILKSPAFSTVGYSAAILSFYHYFEHGFTDPARVDISSDGTSWTNLDTYTSDQGSMASFDHPSYSLSAPFLNQPTVYVRFTYNANQQYYWGIDNVSVTGTPVAPTVTWLPISGLYTDAGATAAYVNGTNLATVYAKPLATTTFTATSTSPAGCTSPGSSTITVNVPVATITPNGPTTFCAGSSVILTASLNSSYLWSTGATTRAITAIASGSYTVTVTDGNGCTAASAAIVIDVIPAPCGVLVTLQPDISGLCIGDTLHVPIHVTGDDIGGFIFLLDFDHSVLLQSPPGYSDVHPDFSGPLYIYDYDLLNTTAYVDILTIDPFVGTNFTGEKVFDLVFVYAGGSTDIHLRRSPDLAYPEWCQVHDVNSFDILPVTYTDIHVSGSSLPLPVAVITPGGPTTFCQGGSVMLTASGGTAGYLWSNAATTAAITVAASGAYTVTVTDVNGCTDTESATVTVNPLPVAAITPGGPTTFCSGGSVVLTASGGTGYLWSNAATTAAITVVANGTYTVTVTNAAGCSNSASRVVTVNPLPTVTITPPGPTAICAGASVVLTASGGTGYLWSNATTTAAITVTVAGTYTVTVTDGSGCTNTASRVVTVNALPAAVITPGGPTTFCVGGSVVLTASGGTGYLWSNAATTAAITVVASGTYTVTVTSAAGCSSIASQVVTVNPSPTAVITPGGPTTFCAGGSVLLTASGGTGYLWSNAATTAAITVVANGTYTVTVTNAAGCSNSASRVVTVNPLPTATITPPGPTAICAGASVVLTASGGTGYLWSNASTTASITVTVAGTYTVTVTDANGCTNTASRVVTVNALPAAVITPGGPTTFCAGGSVSLSASANAGYIWSTGATTQSITATTSGSYTVTVTDGNGCTAVSAATTVTVNPCATVTLLPDLAGLCVGNTFTVHVVVAGTDVETMFLYLEFDQAVLTPAGVGPDYPNFTTNVAPGPGSEFVDIQSNNGVGTNFSGETIVDLYFIYNGGTTDIQFSALPPSVVQNSFGVPISTTYTGTGSITGSANPVAVITPGGPTTLCAGGSVILTASGGTGYLWSNAATTAAITVVASGTYTVTVTNAAGCSNTASQAVTVNPLPTATITPPGPTAICAGASVVLTASGGTGYLWSNTATTASITVTVAGTYTVTVTDANGCSNTASRVVTVNTLPTAVITPNGPTTFCPGGSVILTASGGTGYLWSTTATTAAITVLTTGTYTVTVTDANGCSATASQTVTVADNQPPTFTAPGPISFCVENINTADYFDPTMDITPARPDYYLFSPGNTTLNLNPATFADNCPLTCSVEIRWRISFFDGTFLPPVLPYNTGQPSTFGSNIQFPGSVTGDVTHSITYWIVDCNGNVSLPVTVNVTIKPRPDIIKN
ncbi:MAG: hypothetical protein NT040_08915 [Bacteroidetes bacterium]|nr:hypothetical protein [Bacteroidota bacterium]